MKHFYTVIATAAISLCAYAGAYRSVDVNLLNGSSVKINLADNLSATFEGDSLLVTGGKKDVKIACAAIKSFAFSTEEAAGIDQIGADIAAPVIDGTNLTFNGLPEGSVVEVYNMSGMQLMRQTAAGTFTVDLTDFTAPIVIVKVNNVAFKIATKG
ncbi:MAG: T9SS type A sorting domain-containing protein [Bacteroidales bacterium]|nr:T9SS type A sorting domain-containing protein [Bacteroidales bacterium]MDE6802882.1 T9SS type A sorting domain-containing protein [Muribaculaceae bacterium]